MKHFLIAYVYQFKDKCVQKRSKKNIYRFKVYSDIIMN